MVVIDDQEPSTGKAGHVVVVVLWQVAAVFLGAGQRQTKPEPGSLMLAAEDTNLASHDFYQLSANCQPKTRPAIASTGGAVALVEMIKQVVELLRGNADTGIRDFEIDIIRIVFIPRGADSDDAVTGELHRIADQVYQNLP